MLYFLIKEAKKMKAKELFAEYKHTKKNQPCYEFWESTELDQSKDDKFVFNLKNECVSPIAVKITRFK